MKRVIQGNVDLSELCLTKLPDLSDCEVTGVFICSYNNLTSLVGSPSKVGGDFICYSNQLASLEGAPKSVGMHFDCSDNPIEFTAEAVRSAYNMKGSVIV